MSASVQPPWPQTAAGEKMSLPASTLSAFVPHSSCESLPGTAALPTGFVRVRRTALRARARSVLLRRLRPCAPSTPISPARAFAARAAQAGCPFHNLGGGCPYREFGSPAGDAAPIETVGTAQDHCVAHVQHINKLVVGRRAPRAGVFAPPHGVERAVERAGAAGGGAGGCIGGSVGEQGDGDDRSESSASAGGTAPSPAPHAALSAKRARPLQLGTGGAQTGRAAAGRAEDLAAQGFRLLSNG